MSDREEARTTRCRRFDVVVVVGGCRAKRNASDFRELVASRRQESDFTCRTETPASECAKKPLIVSTGLRA
jgi:hypothetical protein